jgi:Trypsin
MRRLFFVGLLFAILTLAVFMVPPRVGAITYGFVDTTNAFSNTGAFIVKSPTTGQIFPICSGTLIAPDVFLTASHCTVFFTDDLALRGFTALVSFDKSIPFGALTDRRTNLIAVAHVVTNPNFNPSQSDSGDIAVLILEKSVNGITPATLPTAGLLDELAEQNGLKGAVFTAVGYGVQNRVVGGGVPFHQDLNPIPRMFAFSSFHSLNVGYLRLSQNPATGDGGTCFGDSGGPNFFTVDGSQIIAAITITGDSVCRATNVTYRLDTNSARQFLAPFVSLP